MHIALWPEVQLKDALVKSDPARERVCVKDFDGVQARYVASASNPAVLSAT